MSTTGDQTGLDGRLRAAGEHWRSAHTDAVPLAVAELVATSAATSTPPSGSSSPGRSRSGWLSPLRPRWIRYGPIAAAILIIGAIASIAVVGRSGDENPSAHRSASPQPSTPPADSSLIGRRWQLTGWTINHTFTPVDSVDPFEFIVDTNDQIAGLEGCNSLSGTVLITATTIRFGEIATSTVGCTAEENRVSAQIHSVWYTNSPPTWRVAADHLYLTQGSTSLTYQLAPSRYLVTGTLVESGGPAPGAPKPISGTVAIRSGTTADGSVVATAAASADGRFQVSLGPGVYVFTADSPLVSGLPCISTAPLVLPGPSRTVEVECSIK